LFNESFNQPYGRSADVAIDSAIWTESWSGWALNRQGDVVQPWVVPMVVSNSFRIDAGRGAIRFWYRPDWGSENGSGSVATLATLVSAKDGNEATWWSLVVTPDGKEIHLLCQTSGGEESCMSAGIDWAAGDWHLVTMGYTPTNCVLFLDDQKAAVGAGLPTVPKEALPFTGLVLGSTVSGADSASGQIEEVSTFTGRSKFLLMTGHEFGLMENWDIGMYYAGHSTLAALGPISEEEEAARAKRRAEMKAKREAEAEEGDGGGMMRMMGPTSECITNAPLYITNTVCVFDTNAGWTVTFDVQGTNNLADIFTTTNLVGNNITNSQWVWLEQGQSCATYQYTNQLASESYYVLGTMQDSDSDGLTDAYESLVSKTDPNNPDTDGDGVSDGDEVLVYHTDPKNQDSDGDGEIDQMFGVLITSPGTGGLIP